MIQQILYKLRHSADGIWSAHVTPDECRKLLDYIEQLESDCATLAVQEAKKKGKVPKYPGKFVRR